MVGVRYHIIGYRTTNLGQYSRRTSYHIGSGKNTIRNLRGGAGQKISLSSARRVERTDRNSVWDRSSTCPFCEQHLEGSVGRVRVGNLKGRSKVSPKNTPLHSLPRFTHRYHGRSGSGPSSRTGQLQCCGREHHPSASDARFTLA